MFLSIRVPIEYFLFFSSLISSSLFSSSFILMYSWLLRSNSALSFSWLSLLKIAAILLLVLFYYMCLLLDCLMFWIECLKAVLLCGVQDKNSESAYSFSNGSGEKGVESRVLGFCLFLLLASYLTAFNFSIFSAFRTAIYWYLLRSWLFASSCLIYSLYFKFCLYCLTLSLSSFNF